MLANHLKHDLALALDPVRLAHQLGLDPDSWQAALLRAENRQRILLCCRQAGKSTVAALLALHTALYRPPALVLLLSPSLRQSQELYRKVRSGYRALGSAASGVVEETALRLESGNGSRVVSLPGKEGTVRGFSGANLLVVDEASRVPDELYHAVRPMLAVSGGDLVLLSTPFGQRGFFWHEWAAGGEDWLRVKITAHACPRIDPAWLARERAAIGDWWYRQEYGCEFVDAVDAFFRGEDIAAMADPTIVPLFAVHEAGA